MPRPRRRVIRWCWFHSNHEKIDVGQILPIEGIEYNCIVMILNDIDMNYITVLTFLSLFNLLVFLLTTLESMLRTNEYFFPGHLAVPAGCQGSRKPGSISSVTWSSDFGKGLVVSSGVFGRYP